MVSHDILKSNPWTSVMLLLANNEIEDDVNLEVHISPCHYPMECALIYSSVIIKYLVGFFSQFLLFNFNANFEAF